MVERFSLSFYITSMQTNMVFSMLIMWENDNDGSKEWSKMLIVDDVLDCAAQNVVFLGINYPLITSYQFN